MPQHVVECIGVRTPSAGQPTLEAGRLSLEVSLPTERVEVFTLSVAEWSDEVARKLTEEVAR